MNNVIPIQADVWFTKTSRGRGFLYFLIVMDIYNFWYTFGNSLGSTIIICKKLAKFPIFIEISSFKQKYAKRKSARDMINYTFFKSFYDGKFEYARI